MALSELSSNKEQYGAATEQGHCVVIAGPGSGKTKTLTTAMARALMDDITDPALLSIMSLQLNLNNVRLPLALPAANETLLVLCTALH